MATRKKAPSRSGPRHFAIRLAAQKDIAPAGKPRRAYLICNARGPVACVAGNDTGEEDIAAAGFASCPVQWDLVVPYEMIRIALAILPALARKVKD
jgi:hypothetical protein